MLWYLAAALAALVWLYVYIPHWRLNYKMRVIPVAPARLGILGHWVDLLLSPPWSVMRQWLLDCGPLVRFHVFGRTFVLIGDMKMYQHVVHKHRKTYLKDQWSFETFKCILGNGLVTAEGRSWHRQRSRLAQVLRSDILPHTADASKAAVERMMRRDLEIAGGGGAAVVVMDDIFRSLTLTVIARLLVSLPPEEAERVLPELYVPLVEEANLRTWYPWRPYLPTPAWWRQRSNERELNQYLEKLIEERHQRHVRGEVEASAFDILDMLIHAMLENDEWDDSAVGQLRDELRTLILAGHETSAVNLTWSLFQVSQHPRVRDRIRAEAARAFANDGLDVAELKFTECVMRETLRYYTVVPFVARYVMEDDEIVKGVTIAAGTHVLLHQEAIHMDEQVWEEPHVWRPERFEEGKQQSMYAFLPFSQGPRVCIGQHVSLLESKVVLARLVQRFDFELADGESGEVHPFAIPKSPKTGMRMKVRPV